MIEFEGLPASHCLQGCTNMELKTDTEEQYADGEVVRCTNYVYCIHEAACKKMFEKFSSPPSSDNFF